LCGLVAAGLFVDVDVSLVSRSRTRIGGVTTFAIEGNGRSGREQGKPRFGAADGLSRGDSCECGFRGDEWNGASDGVEAGVRVSVWEAMNAVCGKGS
jgi:hypothetical protein